MKLAHHCIAGGTWSLRRGDARHRLAPVVAFLLVGLLLSGLAPAGVAARALSAGEMSETGPGDLVTLRASGEEVATFVAPPAELDGPRLASTQFDVTYNGFSAEAQAAFQYAVDIWSAQLTSPATIHVQAYWEPLGPGILGMAGPNYRVRDFPGVPVSGTWYPAALANKLAGRDLYPASGDIVAYFSSDFASLWYYGTGPTPPGKVNFTSVVLHELGHGLGFTGLMLVAGGWGGIADGNPYPTIYDRFPVDGAGNSLLNTAVYPNPSVALGNALQSGAIRFAGPAATAAAGGVAPRLYAPNPWEPGSSYAHLDEATYSAGSANSLMTPALASGESIYAPGPLALAILGDLGWGTSSPPGGGALLTLTGGGILRIPAGTGDGPYAYPSGTSVTLTPQAPAGQIFTGWIVDGAYRGWATPLNITMDSNHTVHATFVPTVGFPDVGGGREDYAAIVALASRGTIRGYANGTFGPDDGVQRAQMAALIARATPNGPGMPPTPLTPPACLAGGTWDCEDWGNNFTDRNGLDADLWRNVGTLQHYRVALGYDGETCASRGVASPCYGPTEAVSYAQTITFITRMMQAKGYWVAQPSAPLPYSGVPGPHVEDIRTFHYYTGGIPAAPTTEGGWNAGATRGWFAMALWTALNDYWGNGGNMP